MDPSGPAQSTAMNLNIAIKTSPWPKSRGNRVTEWRMQKGAVNNRRQDNELVN
jgi:hypothetical protein